MCLVSYSKESEYGALKKMREFDRTPKWSYIEITNQCNFTCEWCFMNANNQKSKILITLKQFHRILNKLTDIGILQITISGGEPLTHPNIIDIVNMSISKGFKTNIATNGALLTYDLIQKLEDFGLSQLSFNYIIDEDEDEDEDIELLNKIDYIIEKTNIEVVTNTVVSKQSNLDNLNKLFNSSIKRMKFWDNVKDNLTDNDVINIFNKVKEKCAEYDYTHILSYEPLVDGEVKINCPAKQKMLFCIDYNCNVYFCNSNRNTKISSIFDANIYNKYMNYKNNCLCAGRCS